MKKSKILDFLELYREGYSNELNTNLDSNLFSPHIITDNFREKTADRHSHMESLAKWQAAFPDWHLKRKKLEIIGNVAIALYEYSGTYEVPYKETNNRELLKPQFFDFVNKGKLGSRIASLYCECIYIFNDKNLIRMQSNSDLSTLYQQLRITPNNKCEEGIKEALKKLFPLSSRELDCLALILMGFSAKSAATVLFISPRTVETHLKHAYEKLDCQCKKQCHELMIANQTLHLWQEYMRGLYNAKK